MFQDLRTAFDIAQQLIDNNKIKLKKGWFLTVTDCSTKRIFYSPENDLFLIISSMRLNYFTISFAHSSY